MAAPDDEPPPSGEPPAAPAQPLVVRKNRLRLSLVWIVPIVAIIAGVILGARTWLGTGPTITIAFRTAEGLDPGRTEVRYKEVVVGRLQRVELSDDRERVLATVTLDRSAASMAVEDARFWVVRPRIGAAGISGLGTLLSGSYIGVDAGVSVKSQRRFIGLETPPFVLRGEPGRAFVLEARQLGSLEIGSPLYYRRARVGRVVGYELDPVNDALTVQVFVESPFERLVTTDSRFWNASGIDLALDAKGLTVNTESLVSVLAGGIGFGQPPGTALAPQAPSGHHFRLHRDRRTALRAPDGPALLVRMVFDAPMRGLEVGAPVDLLGFEIGTVQQMTLQYDAQRRSFPVEVMAELYPQRLGKLRDQFAAGRPAAVRADAWFVKRLVDSGLRAQVRSTSVLTGQHVVALDFVPRAGPGAFDPAASPPTLPTVESTGDVQQQVADIVKRLERVKFDEIGAQLQELLTSARRSSDTLQQTLANANTMIDRLTPEAQQALAEVRKALVSAQSALASLDRNVAQPDAPLQRNANQTLVELQRAARALRVLGEYLQQHPESLLRGKKVDADPTRTEPAR
jgi:paraquat-inducible protein B